MHVQRVDAQVEGGEVHAVEDLHQGLAPALLHVDDLLGVLLHGPLDEAQQVLLVHAGRGVDVRVHLKKNACGRRTVSVRCSLSSNKPCQCYGLGKCINISAHHIPLHTPVIMEVCYFTFTNRTDTFLLNNSKILTLSLIDR